MKWIPKSSNLEFDGLIPPTQKAIKIGHIRIGFPSFRRAAWIWPTCIITCEDSI